MTASSVAGSEYFLGVDYKTAIKLIVDAAPPFSAAKCDKLALLLDDTYYNLASTAETAVDGVRGPP